MLIEASKGGHVTVVNLLLDWPNHAQNLDNANNQLTNGHSAECTDVSFLILVTLNNILNCINNILILLQSSHRVPMQGLSNVVPPNDPNQSPNALRVTSKHCINCTNLCPELEECQGLDYK